MKIELIEKQTVEGIEYQVRKDGWAKVVTKDKEEAEKYYNMCLKHPNLDAEKVLKSKEI